MEALSSSFDILADFLEAPDRASREVMRRRPIGLGLAAFVASGASFYLARELIINQPSPGFTGLALVTLWQLVSGLVLTALIHLLVEMGGSRGSAVGLFVMMGLSELPWTLAVPAAILCEVAAPGSRLALASVIFLLECVSLSLKVRCIRLMYGVSAGRAWGLLLVPYLAATAFLAAGAAYFSWEFLSLILSWL